MEAKPKAPLIVAHRGAHTDRILENTIEAFTYAYVLDADAIEGDFHLTKDKQIVCHHDAKVQNKYINSATLSELQTIQPTLPTLQNVLQIVPNDKIIYIEIKCGIEIFAVLASVLNHSHLTYDQIVIISFDAEVIHQAKIEYPTIKAYWLYEFSIDEVPDIGKLTKVLNVCQADGISVNVNTHVNETFIFGIQDEGYTFNAWTINSPNEARKLKEWGTLSITTDKVKEMQKSLRE